MYYSASPVFRGPDQRRPPKGIIREFEMCAALDCRVRDAHDAGDHVIYVGLVEDVRSSDEEPLLYYGSRYGSIAE